MPDLSTPTAFKLLNAYGNPIEHYDNLDLDMSRNKIGQTGTIRRFLA